MVEDEEGVVGIAERETMEEVSVPAKRKRNVM